ncbi:MAG: HEAT repeat domain-containing protein [Pirellulales bacterium]|nr:HEAT repeat domain-containing protein [Pirellulales bacterium]
MTKAQLIAAALVAAFLLASTTDVPDLLAADKLAKSGASTASTESYRPFVAETADDAELLMKRVRVPQGMQIELFAAEPLLANPVTFTFDEQGRCYVMETFRLHAGVTDNRRHMVWLDDDLACRTVADRVAMYRKHLGAEFDSYAREHDRVRLLTDSDGDGRPDRATVFADGFRDAADGIGAGLLARGRDVWFACIPKLYLLRDTDGDGTAEQRRVLHDGYGVHVAFLGHDLHGLCLGPDGRLYFSIGDRGMNVETEGRTLTYPDTGCVLRCEPDGSNLEVYSTGLRNPQELAFNELGDLFTGDNNSDSGDRARFVHLVEGGDSGWRIGYQYLTTPVNRGPWNAEKLWFPAHTEQPAYLLPPIANVGDGPSGLAYDPGTGLPEAYRGSFLLADFRGSNGISGVRAIKVKPRGATYELVKQEEFAWSVLATDVEFGVDSAVYISDWVQGWDTTGRGRIYRLFDPEPAAVAQAAEVRKLLAEGMTARSEQELAALLAHRDQRIRQNAQFELATRAASKNTAALKAIREVAAGGPSTVARLHGLWGLGQLARRGNAEALQTLRGLLTDSDSEARAAAAKALGEAHDKSAAATITALLSDAEPRVRFQAAMAVSKLAHREALPELWKMIDAAGDDPYLRHGGVMALAGIGDIDNLVATAASGSPATRMAAVLALRHLERPEVASLLADSDERVKVEAARAIYDVPITAALPQLASLASEASLAEPVAWRVLAANFRVGGDTGAEALAAWAASAKRPEATRVEALRMLATWGAPSGRDAVLGLWRPIAPRSTDPAASALVSRLSAIFASTSDKVLAAAAQCVAALKIREAAAPLAALVADRIRISSVKVVALEALAVLEAAELEAAVKLAVGSTDATLRTAGRGQLARLRADEALPLLRDALDNGSQAERQGALATLGSLDHPQADELLAAWLDRLIAGQLPAELSLDLLTAAAQRQTSSVRDKLASYEDSRRSDDPLADYRECLAGGNVQRGRTIFHEKTEAACLRCHKILNQGGQVGPDLAGIGKRESREHILESIVAPSRKIAKGFESVVLALDDGRVLVGVLRSEDETSLTIITAEGQILTVDKSSIEERAGGASAMPDTAVKVLTKSELRDLVEFLSGLK